MVDSLWVLTNFLSFILGFSICLLIKKKYSKKFSGLGKRIQKIELNKKTVLDFLLFLIAVVAISAAILVFLFLTPIIYNLFKAVLDILIESIVLDFETILREISIFILAVFIVAFFIGYIITKLKKYLKWEVSDRFVITILLMLSLFAVGYMFIHLMYGNNKLGLVFNDFDKNLTKTDVTVECKTWNKRFISNQMVICAFNYNLNVTSLNATFKYIGSDSELVNIKDIRYDGSFEFKAPENIEYIGFDLSYNDNQTFRNLSTGYFYNFRDLEEYDKDTERLVNALFILIGAVFISVPIAVKNLFEL